MKNLIYQCFLFILASSFFLSCKKEVEPTVGTGGAAAGSGVMIEGQPISMGAPSATSVDIYTVADWDSSFIYDFNIKANGMYLANLKNHVCDTSSYGGYYIWGDISSADSSPDEFHLISNFDIADTVRIEYIGTDNKVALAFTLTYLLYSTEPYIWKHSFYSDSTSINYNKLSFNDCSRSPSDWILFIENY